MNFLDIILFVACTVHLVGTNTICQTATVTQTMVDPLGDKYLWMCGWTWPLEKQSLSHLLICASSTCCGLGGVFLIGTGLRGTTVRSKTLHIHLLKSILINVKVIFHFKANNPIGLHADYPYIWFWHRGASWGLSILLCLVKLSQWHSAIVTTYRMHTHKQRIQTSMCDIIMISHYA